MYNCKPGNPAYQSLSQAIKSLLEKGYTADVASFATRLKGPLASRDIMIDEAHLFDESGNRGAEIILLAISSKKYPFRIMLIDAFIADTPVCSGNLLERIGAFLESHRG